jgi:hypothetical protein
MWNDVSLVKLGRQSLNAVLAARDRSPFERDLKGDLRDGERQQREIQALAAQNDRTDG